MLAECALKLVHWTCSLAVAGIGSKMGFGRARGYLLLVEDDRLTFRPARVLGLCVHNRDSKHRFLASIVSCRGRETIVVRCWRIVDEELGKNFREKEIRRGDKERNRQREINQLRHPTNN